MKLNKKTIIPTLAILGLSIGSSVSAAQIIDRPTMFENLTSEQKEILKKVHDLHKEGKYEEAKKLITSAGITLPSIKDYKKHKERKKDTHARIEKNNYGAFAQKVANTPMAKIIDTPEKFDALVQAHELRQEGKYDEAKQVLIDAQLKPIRSLLY